MTWPKTATAIALTATPSRAPILLARAAAIAVAAALVTTAIFATGCKGNGGGSSASAAGGSGIAAARGSSSYGTLVKSGTAPLNYRLGPAGTLRVVDTSAGDAVVATAPVAASSTVNINDAKGVAVNGTIVKPGPLPARHRYQVWLDSTGKQ